jgi:hypothetical protein
MFYDAPFATPLPAFSQRSSGWELQSMEVQVSVAADPARRSLWLVVSEVGMSHTDMGGEGPSCLIENASTAADAANAAWACRGQWIPRAEARRACGLFVSSMRRNDDGTHSTLHVGFEELPYFPVLRRRGRKTAVSAVAIQSSRSDAAVASASPQVDAGSTTPVEHHCVGLVTLALSDTDTTPNCVAAIEAYLGGDGNANERACMSRSVAALYYGLAHSVCRDDPDLRASVVAGFFPLVVATSTTPDDERTRVHLAADWLLREWVPTWLQLANYTDEAAALRALRPITDAASTRAALVVLRPSRAKRRSNDRSWSRSCTRRFARSLRHRSLHQTRRPGTRPPRRSPRDPQTV